VRFEMIEKNSVHAEALEAFRIFFQQPARLGRCDILTAYDLNLTVHCSSLMLYIRRNERCFSRSKDAFVVAYSDAKLSGEHIDHLLLGMLVRLGASSSSEAVTPDLDLSAFDRRSFGG
jgi:hypothetical protein